MATTTRAKRRNPTQADIIAVMLAQAVNDAQDKVNSTFVKDVNDLNQHYARREAIASRNTLIAFKQKVERYLAGDISVLIG